MANLERIFMWHGSAKPIDGFGGDRRPTHLHLGSLAQAVMRSGNQSLHLFEVNDMRLSRVRDWVSDKPIRISTARRKGYQGLVYLNRYEGIPKEETLQAIEIAGGQEVLDAMPAARFRRLCPSAEDSLLALDLGKLRFLGCYQGKGAAFEALVQRRLAAQKMPQDLMAGIAAQQTLNAWIGLDAPMIIEEKDLSKRLLLSISDTKTHITHLYAHAERTLHAADQGELIVLKQDEGCSYLAYKRSILAIDRASGQLAGGISRGMPLVLPEFRCRGIATEMHILNDQYKTAVLNPLMFSRGGFEVRRSAHREICRRALSKGMPVHEDNIDRYGLAAQQAEAEPF